MPQVFRISTDRFQETPREAFEESQCLRKLSVLDACRGPAALADLLADLLCTTTPAKLDSFEKSTMDPCCVLGVSLRE
jgi:hypothetical protein